MPEKKKYKNELEANWESIQKWINVAFFNGLDKGGSNCPLCQYHNKEYDRCKTCIVAYTIDNTGCRDTPFWDWADHHLKCHSSSPWLLKVECPECQRLALKEVDFLYECYIKSGGTKLLELPEVNTGIKIKPEIDPSEANYKVLNLTTQGKEWIRKDTTLSNNLFGARVDGANHILIQTDCGKSRLIGTFGNLLNRKNKNAYETLAGVVNDYPTLQLVTANKVKHLLDWWIQDE